MVVDDDRSTVSLLTMLLEMDGFQVIQSPKPQPALEKARAGSVDAFVVDCHLGGHNGLDLVREIRLDADLAATLVIVTSGKDLSQEAMEAGADLFMPKPFSPNELSAKLTEFLSKPKNA
jgi:DNA-binding response OmpR family regulator